MRTVDTVPQIVRGNFIWKSHTAPVFNTTDKVSGKIISAGNVPLGKRVTARVYFSQATSNEYYQLVRESRTLRAVFPGGRKFLERIENFIFAV